MGSTLYREVKKRDYGYLEDLINRTWKVDSFIEGRGMVKRILGMYLCDCLMNSTFGLLAEVDGEPAGVLLGRANGEPYSFGRLWNSVYMLFSLSALPFTSRSNRKMIMEYVRVLRVYRDLLESRGHLYQGEVVLLIVSEEFQGYGIGRGLMNRLKAYFSSLSVSRFYVYTDTCCNYGFYDSQGFTLTDQEDLTLHVEEGPLPMTIYLYSYGEG